MNEEGELRKMPATLDANNKVHYQFCLFNREKMENVFSNIEGSIGRNITIRFSGKIFCKKCGKETKTSFNQGFCYNCFRTAPESAECIIRPELCRAHLGEGRDPVWENENHNQPHIVYLAASDVVKVGVTRVTQIPTRWIDQGASSAIKLAETSNRYEAGLIEVALKSTFTDKTNWRKMLTNQVDESIDLEETKWQLAEQLPRDISQYISADDKITTLHYPVVTFPQKVKSVDLEKTPSVSGKLVGIKGQYLLLEGGQALNIRRHAGYQINLAVF